MHAPGFMFANETLVRSGFLGATPERPTIAISIELLEIYRQLRRVCPRLSLDALSRALCHLHHVSFFRCNVTLLTWLSVALSTLSCRSAQLSV